VARGTRGWLLCEKKNALGTGLMTITSLTLELGMWNFLTETDKTPTPDARNVSSYHDGDEASPRSCSR
jgi:hypothetical protein